MFEPISWIKQNRVYRHAFVVMVLSPLQVWAAEPSATSTMPGVVETRIQVDDIALQADGALLGQVVNSAGLGVAETLIQLTDGHQQWQTKTNAQGCFRVDQLCGGTYRVKTHEQSRMLRVWSAGTAPPSAHTGVLFAPTSDIVRGQRPVSPNTNQFFRVAKRRLANPWVVGGIVATAVTIPVAIHNADDDPPPASP